MQTQIRFQPNKVLDIIGVAFSAYMIASGIALLSTEHAPFAVLFFLIGVEPFKDMRQRKREAQMRERNMQEFYLLLGCIDDLAQELGKHAGPKITNDILRKHHYRLLAHYNHKPKDPPKGGGFLGLFGKKTADVH